MDSTGLMQGVVPAAGLGSRLRPLTEAMPKGLVPVQGRPLLSHSLSTLVDLGIPELIVIVGHRGEEIIEYYGYEFEGVPITYVRQRNPIGLANAVVAAEHEITGDFVLLNGDNIVSADLDQVVAKHREEAGAVTLLVDSVSVAAARQTGVVEFDEDNTVVGLVEKPEDPPSRCVTTGFFVFAPIIFDACRLVRASSRGEYELSTAIDVIISSGRQVETVPLYGWRVNVNTPADRARAIDLLGGQHWEGEQ